MYFVDQDHEKNFTILLNRFSAHKDPEYKTACYVVALPEIWNTIGGETGEYPFSWVENEKYDEEQAKKWEEIKYTWRAKESKIDRTVISPYSKEFDMLSSGYQKIVLAAGNLFNSGWNEFNLMDSLGTWGDELFSVFLQAITIRRSDEDTFGRMSNGISSFEAGSSLKEEVANRTTLIIFYN